MNRKELLNELQSSEEYFLRSTDCLEEADSEFTPVTTTLSVSQQVAHCAQTIDWFIDAVESASGFDLDFESHWTEVRPISSLTEARKWLQRSFSRAREVFATADDAQLLSELPAGPVMGGEPRYRIVSGIVDHTAHHRGALTIYSRLLNKEPKMPYVEMP